MISRPDLWATNTEIAFGDGLYGYRKTGTLTVAARTRSITNIVNNVDTIVGCGGWWTARNNLIKMSVTGAWVIATGVPDIAMASCIDIDLNTNYIRLVTSDEQARTDAPYDVWVLYTKV